jgi:hypothetical protein
MTALRAGLRVLAGAAVVAAAVGVPASALAGERAEGDPTLRLHCPSAARVVESSDHPYRGYEGSVRDQVLRALPHADPYTQANMRGRLDLRTSYDDSVSTAVVRGQQHEPIAVYRFELDGGGWALRSSTQCRSADLEGDRRTLDRSLELTCPGWSQSGLGCGGGGSPGRPVDRALVNETPPEVQVRRELARNPGSYPARNLVEPLETTTRFENTWAQVVARDAARNVIATWTYRYEQYGWWRPLDASCVNGPPGTPPV